MLNREIEQLLNCCETVEEFRFLIKILTKSNFISYVVGLSSMLRNTRTYYKGNLRIVVTEILVSYTEDYLLSYYISGKAKNIKYFRK